MKKIGSYFVTKEKRKEADIYVIRRKITNEDGTVINQRHPHIKYRHLKTKEDIQKYVDRINGRENRRAIKEIQGKLAFIPNDLLQDFREELQVNIPNQKDSKYLYQLLHKHCLSFFVDQLKLKDPLEWKENESKWGAYLISTKLSPKSIKTITQVGNRFLSFVHKKFPREIPLLKLEPLSKARIKALKAERKNKDFGQFIKDDHWRLIEKNLPDRIKPFVLLGYYYGLRRAESLAIELEDLRKGYLSVERQLISTNKDSFKTKPLKSKKIRKTPHWFIKPDRVYQIIANIDYRLHPDTLGVEWSKLMDKLSLDYALHDLRRTFITKALRAHAPVDVQHAVGHSDIRTTMQYQQDDRNLDAETFVLKKRKI